MKPRSKHFADVTVWVNSVINSCTNLDQIKVAYKLIDNYAKIYEKDELAMASIKDMRYRVRCKAIKISEEDYFHGHRRSALIQFD